MPPEAAYEPLAPVRTIMERHGVRCSPEEFHDAVHVAFHNFEAEVHDKKHSNMWQSLPREFNRLVDDCAAVTKGLGELYVLDIGYERFVRKLYSG